MSNIVAESCPDWCITDHSGDSSSVTVLHCGQPQTFGECTIAFGDGPAAPIVMFPTSTTSAGGVEVRRGAMVSGRFLDEAALRAFADGLSVGR